MANNILNCTLYRIYNSDGVLLYVGATTRPGSRFRLHEGDQPWWNEVSMIKLQHFNDWDECAEAEAEAIKAEKPRHNQIHLMPSIWFRGPRQSPGTGSLYQRANGLWVGFMTLPSVDGKQRRKYVSSKDRATARRKLQALQASLKM